MKQELMPNLENEPLDVKTLYPDPDYFKSWSEVKEEYEEEVIDKIIHSDCEIDIISITHTDADGYGCDVMLREAYPTKNVVTFTASESGPLTVDFVGSLINDYADNSIPIFIMDLAPDFEKGREFIDSFRSFHFVTVIDHHEWEKSDYNQIEWVANVYHDTDRCATKIVHDELIDNPRPEITELAKLTQDHDLWIKEQREQSDKLSLLASTTEINKYVKLCREHGVNVINSKEGGKLIQEEKQKQEKKQEIALNRLEKFELDNEYKIGFTYGRCNASTVGEEIYKNEDCNIACIMFPSGSISLRTDEDTPVARDIATHFNGGGHLCAAGAKPKFVGSVVDYTTHWATKGKALQKHLVDNINNILN